MAQDRGARALSDATINQLLESAPDAIVIVDLDGTIRHVNAAAERLFVYSRAALFGQNVDLLLPDALRQAHVAHRNAYAAEPRARPMGVGLELSGLRSDRTPVPIEISLSPLDADGQLLVTAIVRDVTERRRAEERVRRSEARLAEAQQIAHVGSWEWEIASGELRWSDELCRIYGVDPTRFTPTFPSSCHCSTPMTVSVWPRSSRRLKSIFSRTSSSTVSFAPTARGVMCMRGAKSFWTMRACRHACTASGRMSRNCARRRPRRDNSKASAPRAPRPNLATPAGAAG